MKQWKWRAWYNKTVVLKTWKPGDRVLMWKPRVKGKFKDKWMGPLTIEKVIGKGAYLLSMLEGELYEKGVHGDNLKDYIQCK